MTPVLIRSRKPFSIAGMKVAGNRAADDRVDPQEVALLVVVHVLELREPLLRGPGFGVGAFGERVHADVDLAELPRAARLLLVPVAALAVRLDRFAVGNLRLVRLDLDMVAPLEPLLDQRQVQLAHAGEHHFLGLGVVVEVDRAVFFGDLVQCARELRLVAAALGRHGQADHRRGELQRRQLDVAQRRAGVQVFALGDGHDVARARLRRPGGSPTLAFRAAAVSFTPLRACG